MIWIWVNQILSGILLGGYYALLACGLSLLFGVMRVINLAHGDLAVLSAFLVWVLCQATGISPFLGLAAVLPVMAAVGWGLQRFMLERSLKAGMLVPLLSTFGLAIVIENLLFAQFGADTRSLAPAIGDLSYAGWTITSQIYIGQFPVLVFAVAVLLLLGLQLFMRRTQLGRAIRATAEDPDTAELVGIDSRRVYGIAAAIAVATLAIAGTFLAIRATFAPYAGPDQLIFAFEAVVIGGIGSLWGTLVGGIILGVAQNVGAQFDSRWFLLAGHITFLAVLALRLVAEAVSARGGLRAILGEDRVSARSLGLVQRWTPVSVASFGGLAALVVALAFAPLVLNADYVDKLTTLFVYVILAAMWNALAGYGGLVSVGQQAFFGLGAYFAIRLSYQGVPVYPALVIGAIGAGIVGWPISWLMLRLKGGEFAIGMWVVAEICHLLVNLDKLIQGETGTSLIALDALTPDARRADNYWLALGAMVLFLGLVFILLRSRLGASVQAIRDDEEAAASVGVKVLAGKRVIFLLAALGCGAAGAIFLATSITFQPRTYFGVQWSAYMIFMALVGGLGTFEGGIIGAILFFLVQNEFGEIGVWYLVGVGAVAILFALFLPRGIWGTIEDRFGLRLMPVGYRLRLDDPG